MQDLVSLRTRRAAVGVLVLGLTACDEHLAPNSPTPFESPRASSEIVPRPFYAIGSLSLSTKLLVLNGAYATYTAVVFSSTNSFKDLTLRGSFIQQQVRHAAGTQGIPCAVGNSTCTVTRQIQASGLVPGAAVFELELLSPGGTVVSTADIDVIIESGQVISALTATPTSLVVGGPLGTYNATLQNQSSVSASGAVLQGWVVQRGANPAREPAGSIAVQCGSGAGVLPAGSCTMSSTITLSNTTGGLGTLVAGPALFELDLSLNGQVMSVDTVPVTIVSNASITAVRLGAMTSDTLLLEGSSASYTAALQNIGASLTGVSIQSFVTQGTTRRFAGGGLIACGSAAGVLANGVCSAPAAATASNNTAGTGTLVTGGASLEVQLLDATGIVLSSATLPVFVVDGPLESGPPGPSAIRAPRRKAGGSLR